MKSLLAVAMALVTSLAWADGKSKDAVEVRGVKGEAAITDPNNKPAARQEAINQALRSAVETGAGLTIDTATLTEGSTLISDKIFSHANGYVRDYKIRDGEDHEDGNSWVVTLDATVSASDLSRDAAAVRSLLISKGHPRMMLMISEQSVEDAAPRGWWVGQKDGQVSRDTHSAVSVSSGVVEQEIISQLNPAGWKFIDPQVAFEKIKVHNSASTSLDDSQAREYGKVTGAEYVILGTVLARPMDSGGGMTADLKAVSYRTSLRAVKVDNGEVVATVNDSDQVVGVLSISDSATKALIKAADKASTSLVKGIVEDYRQAEMGDSNLHMTVSVTDYDVLQTFKQVLTSSVGKVKSVKQVSWADGKADLSLEVAGVDSDQLAGSLSNKSIKGLTVKVVKVTPNTLEVKLVR